MYIYIYIEKEREIDTYIYIYIYIYTHMCILSAPWKPSGRFLDGFRRRHEETFVYGFSRRISDGFCRRRIQNFRMYRVIPRFVGF